MVKVELEASKGWALIIKPNGTIRYVHIACNELKSFQESVGGNIQIVPIKDEKHIYFVNDSRNTYSLKQSEIAKLLFGIKFFFGNLAIVNESDFK